MLHFFPCMDLDLSLAIARVWEEAQAPFSNIFNCNRFRHEMVLTFWSDMSARPV